VRVDPAHVYDVLRAIGRPVPVEALAFALLVRPAELKPVLEEWDGKLWRFDGTTVVPLSTILEQNSTIQYHGGAALGPG